MQRRTRTRLSLSFVTVVAGLAAMSGAALGAVGLGPLRFFPSGSPFAGSAPTTQSVALNVHGDAVVGEEVRSQNGTLATPTVRTRSGARGAWSPTAALAKPSNDTSEPQVAINAAGNRIAVFRRLGRYVASRQRATGWTLSNIDAPAPTTDDVSAITITPSGRARFVHALPDAGCDPIPATCPWTVWVYDQAGAGAFWTRGDDSLRIPPTQRPVIAVNGRGDVLVAWATPGASGRVNASRRLVGETVFESPLSVSDPGVRGDVDAAIGDGGDAAIGWVHPDAPGTGSGFTGRIDVSIRRDNLPLWASPETVVPAGAANPDFDLAVDSAANVVLAWTTFPASAGAPFTVDAAIRSSATSVWVPSPRLDSAATGDGESLTLLSVLAAGGRAFVTYEKHLGPDANLERLAVGGPTGWNVRTLAGNADPTAASGDAARALGAVAQNGSLILVSSGLQVRNDDAATTLAAARAGGLAVKVTGRSAELRFRLNTQSRVFVQRRSGANFTRTGEYAPKIFPAGANRMNLGRLPIGRYLVGIGACSRSRGCTATRLVAFRIR